MRKGNKAIISISLSIEPREKWLSKGRRPLRMFNFEKMELSLLPKLRSADLEAHLRAQSCRADTVSLKVTTVRITEMMVLLALLPATAASGKISENAPKTEVDAKVYQVQMKNTFRWWCFGTKKFIVLDLFFIILAVDIQFSFCLSSSCVSE